MPRAARPAASFTLFAPSRSLPLGRQACADKHGTKPLPIPECRPYKPSRQLRLLGWIGRLTDRVKSLHSKLMLADVMEELMKFTLLTRDAAPYLVDRYSERKESAEALSRRVQQTAI